MDPSKAGTFLEQHSRGVMITIRGDGRPQSSNIVYHWDGEAALVSVTDDRAKVKNLRRDPRATLHVSSQDFWRYVVVDGSVQLTEVSTTPGDEVGRMLLDLYNAVSRDPHPDPDEFFDAMVRDRRLVARLSPSSFYGTVR